MMLYVLGNGFSIDLVRKLNADDSIDLFNLFSKGDNIPTDDVGGYLSSRFCENLCEHGLSPKICKLTASDYMNEIITSFNVYAKWNKKFHMTTRSSIGNKYIETYNQLNKYLKKLFIYYDSLISDERLLELIKNENIALINNIKLELEQHSHIDIITYNYDIFLERLLDLCGIRYNVDGFNYDSKNRITIYKPHGSINFDLIQSKYEVNMIEGLTKSIDKFKITNRNDLSYEFKISALIPPFGDANQNANGWIGAIQQGINNLIVSESDEVYFFGLSYGEIDRNEIDEILIKIPERTKVFYINPKPTRAFDYVLKTMFKNYKQLTHLI